MKLHFSLIIFLASISVQLNSKDNEILNLNIKQYNVGDGLPSNEVQGIKQDDKGFIWFATTNGLSRYDGYEFMNFRSSFDCPDMLSSNTILDMEELNDTIWIVTPNGVDLLDKKISKVRHVVKDSLKIYSVKCIMPISHEKILMGGTEGLWIYNGRTDSLMRIKHPLLSHVRDMFMGSTGKIWIGTWEKGLYTYDSKTNEIVKIESKDIPEDIAVTKIMEDKNGNMYISTWGDGLYYISSVMQYDMKVLKFAVKKINYNHLDWNIIYDMDFDTYGNLWLGSPGGFRIIHINNEKNKFIEKKYCIDDAGKNYSEHNEIQSVFKSHDGTMWLSNYGRGVISVKIANSDIEEFDFNQYGYSSNAVTAIHRISEDIFLFGVSGHGILMMNILSKQPVKSDVLDMIDAESNAVVCFTNVPGANSIFMATRYYGVYQMVMDGERPISINHYDVDNESIRNNFTNAAIADKDGNIWIGTTAGVVILKRNQSGYAFLEPYTINRTINNVGVETLYSDSSGNIWVGSSETGLFKLKVNGHAELLDIKIYSVKNGLINNDKISSIFEDSKGRLWVGTHGGGLCLYDSICDRFNIIEDMYSFPSDVISSITEDKSGALWISTANGFVNYNPNMSFSNVVCYGAGRGLKNLTFIKNAVWTDGTKVIFGGYNGITMFNVTKLAHLKNELDAPNIVDIRIFNKSISAFPEKTKKAIIDGDPPYFNHLTLKHQYKSLSIKFASPYENGAGTKYLYYMDGLEKNWNYANSNQRIVTYNNLKPGNYKFVVKSASDETNYTSEPTAIYIKMKPAPWFTWWAELLYLFMITVVIITAYYIIRNRVRLSEALKIEQLERIKSEEVNNAKLTFFTNISHELFTPITIMSCSIEKLLEKEGIDTHLHKILRSNLNRLLRLLQQVLEFRKAESSNLKLKVSSIDIVSFVKKICDENFAPMINDKNIKLIFTATQDTIIGYVDSDKLDKILYNLLSNAYKYNRYDGRVFVDIDQSAIDGYKAVTISVKDTGYGISKEQQETIFKRFYDGDYRKFNTKGTGIGLSLTKELITLHKGNITVDSEVGVGTSFKIVIPIEKDAYSIEQIECLSEQTTMYGTGLPLTHNDDKICDATLLLVEDNAELLFVMKKILEARYNIFIARNGTEALNILHDNNSVDLIITDYLMPEMDGEELCRIVRSELEISHLPIIMLSAKSAEENKLKSYQAGVDAYVTKPFDLKLLVAQVDGILENRKKLYSRFRAGKNSEIGLLINTDLDKQFIDKVIRLVESHISDSDFNIEAFNDAMNMSNSTLYRKIKGLTGMSPKEFVRNIRFKYASKLLLEKTANIADVAFMVGFTDAKYFSQCFKKEFGKTPSQYVLENKK